MRPRSVFPPATGRRVPTVRKGAPVRHAPGRYRDYREKYALTTGEVTARYCENITNPTVQPDGKTEMHTPIPDVAHVEQSKAYQEENQL